MKRLFIYLSLLIFPVAELIWLFFFIETWCSEGSSYSTCWFGRILSPAALSLLAVMSTALLITYHFRLPIRKSDLSPEKRGTYWARGSFIALILYIFLIIVLGNINKEARWLRDDMIRLIIPVTFITTVFIGGLVGHLYKRT